MANIHIRVYVFVKVMPNVETFFGFNLKVTDKRGKKPVAAKKNTDNSKDNVSLHSVTQLLLL